MKKLIALFIVVLVVMSAVSCGNNEDKGKESPVTDDRTPTSDIIKEADDVRVITLHGSTAEIDGKAITEYDYVWHADPSSSAPYFTGTMPSGSIYIAHDIVYYPEIPTDAFTLETLDGEREWVTHYTAAGLEEYLFSTLPSLGSEIPTEMMHSSEEAYANPVLHICEAGKYEIRGTWNGQIKIDLGDGAKKDENAKITLILSGCTINCTAAPAVLIASAYECDSGWSEAETHGNITDLKNAGAKIIISDGTENNVSGTNVFRMYLPQYKKEGSTSQVKLAKTDAAFYSTVSMSIDSGSDGTGILNITSGFEGLDSELHMTINGGYVNIVSQDDGINVNEDGVSVFTMNGGRLTIFAGQGAEGDVIDSNGFIKVNGGVICGASPSVSDDIFDSDCGTEVSDEATVISNVSGKSMDPGGFRPDDPGERPDDPGSIPGGFDPGSRPDDPGNPGDSEPGDRPDGDPGAFNPFRNPGSDPKQQ